MVQFSNLQPSSCFRDVLLMKTHRPLREDPRKQAFFDYSKATAKYKEKTWLLDDVVTKLMRSIQLMKSTKL